MYENRMHNSFAHVMVLNEFFLAFSRHSPEFIFTWEVFKSLYGIKFNRASISKIEL